VLRSELEEPLRELAPGAFAQRALLVAGRLVDAFRVCGR